MQSSKISERSIPGMNRHARFVEAEHAENVRGTLKRIVTYFLREKGLVFGHVTVVLLGTLCGVYAPSLQSRAIDVIAGTAQGTLSQLLLVMLGAYFLYGISQLVQT